MLSPSRILASVFPTREPDPTVAKLEMCKSYIENKGIDKALLDRVDLLAGAVFGTLAVFYGFWICLFGIALVGVGLGTIRYFSVEIPPSLNNTVSKIGEIFLKFKGIRTSLFLLGILLMQVAPNPTSFTASFIATIAVYRGGLPTLRTPPANENGGGWDLFYYFRG
jgi:hypothetical protein